MKHTKVVVIAGPTASGKSSLALDLAVASDGVVINADSMQVYQGLPILSAVPSAEERRLAEHRLYEIYPPSQNGTVVDWLNLAAEEIRRCWEQERLPVVVGGTGMYLDNLIRGTTPIPEPDAEIRAEVTALFNNIGAAELHRHLELADEAGAAMINPNDASRVRRAYEIFLQTGKSIAWWYGQPLVQKLPEASFRVVKILPPAEELDARCYRRFEKMLAEGAVEEVMNLLRLKLNPTLPAMKMLGVQELRDYLENRCSLEEAAAAAKLHTRQYAKRQRTWFRNKLDALLTLDKSYTSDTAVIKGVKKIINCCT